MWSVAEVAEQTELPARTVRYYDKIGLVRPNARTDAGYRLYDGEGEARLRFVKQARGLGFSIDEVRRLLAAAEAGCCQQLLPELDRLLDHKIIEIEQRVAELSEFRDRLAAFRAGRGSACGCHGHSAFCGCLEGAPTLVNTKKGGRGHGL